MEHTPGPWVVESGEIDIQDQADFLIADIGTDREWCAIGIEDSSGFAEIVALAHPINANLIAAAPTMYDYIKSKAESGDIIAIEIINSINNG